MIQVLVAVIDGSKARFLTLEPAKFPERESSPNLIEHESLFNPVHEQQGRELWANVKTGRNKGLGGKTHAYDDRREQHIIEFERRFAQLIADEIVNLTQAKGIDKLLLVAEPQILGIMRETVVPVLSKNLQIEELAKDLCKLKPLAIHEHLASKNLLPSRKRVSV